MGQREEVHIHGDDYPTRDGTAVRDYIHVTDLSKAHILAMKKLFSDGKSENYNVGTGKGYSIREVLEMARKITGHEIPISIGPKRQGDPSELVADTTKIQRELGWSPEHSSLENILATAWNWHRIHPNGYKKD